VGEGGFAQRRGVRGAAISERDNPSSVVDFVRATFSHKGRRKKQEESIYPNTATF
jgi:hypothetical protein